MGLADFHQYHPSKEAIQESDLILMIGGRLDNQMNFGNAPFFPVSTRLICVNGSDEELNYNRAADELLLSDPGAFLQNIMDIEKNCKRFEDEERNVFIRIASQASENDLIKICKDHGPFDFIVDDGGHSYEMMKTSIETLFPSDFCMTAQSRYVIEDMHTMVMKNQNVKCNADWKFL